MPQDTLTVFFDEAYTASDADAEKQHCPLLFADAVLSIKMHLLAPTKYGVAQCRRRQGVPVSFAQASQVDLCSEANTAVHHTAICQTESQSVQTLHKYFLT